MITNHKDLVDKLLTIFQIVNDWLKYADSKNAVMLAFYGATITGIVSCLSSEFQIPQSLKLGLIVSTVFLSISVILNLVAFLPKTDSDKYFWTLLQNSRNITPSPDRDNLYFYGDLRKYSDVKNRSPNPDKLIEAISNAYDLNCNNPFPKEAQDISLQIIINSDIAFKKFELANLSIRLAFIALISIPLSMVFSLIVYRHL